MITDPANAREYAVKRLTSRREFGTHVVAYLVFNTALVFVWYVTGHGYFWPGWLIGIWGAGLLIHTWDVFGRRPISEADIRKEMERRGGGHAFPHRR